ncbi:hypothetical protein VNI00_003807 [Paramarasmius palmivorus]|uniref:DNA (cytosine-5-)-methyltransferase n=1 Tax=Paramarasmius palmivorus TaxID=297713 RepID=A0AAW0DNN2_9AGAR
MTRHHSLNLDKQYCPHWTTAEGLREIMQNWFDGMIASYDLYSPDRLKVVEARLKKQNGKTIRRFNAFVDSVSKDTADAVGYIEHRYFEKKEKEEESEIKFSDGRASTSRRGDSGEREVGEDNGEEWDDDSDFSAEESEDEYSQKSLPKKNGKEKRKEKQKKTAGGKQEDELIIVNKRASITYNKLRQGKTTKASESDSGRFIGRYGDGMKVGIVAMLRDGLSVIYYTNRMRWKFFFYADKKYSGSVDELWVAITYDKKKKATYNCDKDTRVSIKGVPLAIASHAFDNALFCCPPSPEHVLQTARPSPIGRVLTGKTHVGKLFGSSIFICNYSRVDKGGPFLYYGYDVRGGVNCSRDRNNPDIKEATNKITQIWSECLLEEANRVSGSTNVTSKAFSRAEQYLKLFEMEGFCMDTAGARKGFSDAVIKHLWRAYLHRIKEDRRTSAFWIYNPRKSDGDDESPSRIIKSMGMVPITPPETLVMLFEDHELVMTAREKREATFMSLNPSPLLSSTDAFPRYVAHSIHVIQEYDRYLRGLSFAWKDVGSKKSIIKEEEVLPEVIGAIGNKERIQLDLDVVVDRHRVFLNDRNLSLHDVHVLRRNCPEYLSRSDNETCICNCSVRLLALDMVDQIYPTRSSRMRAFGDMMDLMAMCPHRFSSKFVPASENAGELTVSWTTYSSSKGFTVELREQGTASVTKTLKRTMVDLVDASDCDDSSDEEVAMQVNAKGEESDNANAADADPAPDRCTTFLTSADSSVSIPTRFAGQKLRVQACSSRTDISVAYSVPFDFDYPLNQVKNIVARLRDGELYVSFFPVDGAHHYLLTITFIGEEPETFELKETDWSKSLGCKQADKISLTAVSVAGVSSHSESAVDVVLPCQHCRDRIGDTAGNMDHEDLVYGTGGGGGGFSDDSDDDSDDRSDDDADLNTISSTPSRSTTSMGTLVNPTSARQATSATSQLMPKQTICICHWPKTIPSYQAADPSVSKDLVKFEEHFESETISRNLVAASCRKDQAIISVELGVTFVGKSKIQIRPGSVIEATLNTTTRFRHFLLCIESIYRNDIDQDIRLHCQRYLSQCDFLDSKLGTDPSTFALYSNVLREPQDLELFLVTDDATLHKVCEIRAWDIQTVEHVFDDFEKMKPEDGVMPHFKCSSALCFSSRAQSVEHILPLSLLPGSAFCGQDSRVPKPTSIRIGDFQASVGGFSDGFRRAGWVPTAAVEDNVHACNTLKAGLLNLYTYPASVLTPFSGQSWFDYFPKPAGELTVALVSTHKGDPSCYLDGQTIKHCVDVQRSTGTGYLLVEFRTSVTHPELIHHLHRALVELKDLGMQSHWAVLDAKDYGAPISQSRLFLIASKIGLTLPDFPSATHGYDKIPYVTVQDAIADLAIDNPRIENAGDNPAFLCSREHNRYARSMGARDLIENHTILGSDLDLTDLPQTSWNKPCKISQNAWRVPHPDGKRLLSPRELARIKTFRDDYVFTGPAEEQMKQITNTICPILAKAFGETFKAAIIRDNEELKHLFTNNPASSSEILRLSKRGISELDAECSVAKRSRVEGS